MNELINLGIINKNDKAVVSNRVVAEKFEKEHAKVARDIENLIAGIAKNGDPQTSRFFIESKYKNEQNKQFYKEYLLTRDSFSLLVMGVTGMKSLEWKLKYIQAFNKMEIFIREKLSSEWQETRVKGKLARRTETDVIMTKLIPLAISQGE